MREEVSENEHYRLPMQINVLSTLWISIAIEQNRSWQTGDFFSLEWT